VGAFDPKTGKQKAVWKLDHRIGGRNTTTQCICANGDIIQVCDGNTATILVDAVEGIVVFGASPKAATCYECTTMTICMLPGRTVLRLARNC
jgi:hypothetical protein